jgi:RNA polymerase sigma-70 factor (TIGR02960 family)
VLRLDRRRPGLSFVLSVVLTPAGSQSWRLSAPPSFRRGRCRYWRELPNKAEGEAVKGGRVTADLIDRARAGNGQAFGELVAPYRRELQVHCYRILGSALDAEDALQETLLAAWRGLPGFQGRASVRVWLYQIATRRCLNALRAGSRRPPMDWPPPGVELPEPTRLGEVMWLEPYPDVLLEGLADAAPGPEARYETTEAISVAFVTALQLLPPRQRAALILRDVLGFRASEAAGILDCTQESVTSALKRARAALQYQRAQAADRTPPPGSAQEQSLVQRFTRAYEAGDVDVLIALLTEDAWLVMPPVPLRYQGRELAGRFWAATAFRPGRSARLVPTRANGQPAFGLYIRDSHAPVAHANGILVLTLAGNQISAVTGFLGTSALPIFGLPRTLPD